MSVDTDFEQYWVCLTRSLHAGNEVFHWSALGGYLEGSFFIYKIDLDREEILLRGHSAIPKREFARFFPRWREYCNGPVTRGSISEGTFASTYVISIMHHLDKIREGRDT